MSHNSILEPVAGSVAAAARVTYVCFTDLFHSKWYLIFQTKKNNIFCPMSGKHSSTLLLYFVAITYSHYDIALMDI